MALRRMDTSTMSLLSYSGWFADTNVSSPRFTWSSGESVSILLGQNLSLECVAQGVPAPQIVWEKYGGVLPADRHHVTLGTCHMRTNITRN